MVEEDPQNGQAHAKYAMALLQAGKEAEGERAFETALEILEDNALIKRYYAPYLVSKNELDRAMDFYEDALEVAPGDVPTLIEYAQTLEAAGREFEVPNVLKQVLGANPDPDTRAQVMARLIELEQPKRAESVENARMKMESGDFQGAIRDLKPLRNWLADYWKLWALLSSAYNRTEQYTEAEDASRRLLELYPGCEPGYGEMVQALSGQDRAEEAFQMMQYAASNNPSSLPIHLNLGLAAKRAGYSDVARDLAKQIREAIGPNEELEPVLAEMES
jgi:tetratricopeptide (TPR) repeat protein